MIEVSKRKSSKKTPDKKKRPQTESIAEKGKDKRAAVNIRRHFPILLVCLLLIVTTLAVYWQMRNHEFVDFDDDVYVTENRYVQAGLTPESIVWALTTDHAGFRIPLTWLSLMLDFELYGLYAGGYHLTNLLLHLANVLLLFLILKRMTGALWRSAFVAALFALHPLHVESVAWVTERKDVLSTLFWLLTMWGYLRYVDRPGVKRYLVIVVTFTLGLMAKPMLVTLPFVLLLLDYWPLGRLNFGQSIGDSGIRIPAPINYSQPRPAAFGLVWEKTPLFALAATSSVLTLFAQKAVGALSPLDTIPFKVRLANALVAYVKYVGKAVWPLNLAVLYPHPETNISILQAAGAGLLLTCITILVIRMARRLPYLAVGWLWYLGTLVPVIGLVQVGLQAMSDRFTYVPLIGLYIIFAWGIPELVAGWRHQRLVLSMAAGAAISALMICSWLQVRYWKNSVTLFRHALNVTIDNYVAHNNLGISLERQGDLDEAISHYNEALRINPSFVPAYDNRGKVLLQQGMLDEAMSQFSKALELNSNDAIAHYNMGVALARKGNLDRAITHYTEALEIKPDYAEAHNNLGDAFLKQGRHDEAISHFFRSLQIKSNHAEAHNNLGIALARQGRMVEATTHYAEALQIEPNFAEAHNNLGIALARQGNLDGAIAHFTEALEIKPNYAEAHNNLGVALARKGRFEYAKEHFAKALQFQPDSEKAKKNLEWVLQKLDKSRKSSTTIDRPYNKQSTPRP